MQPLSIFSILESATTKPEPFSNYTASSVLMFAVWISPRGPSHTLDSKLARPMIRPLTSRLTTWKRLR